MFEWDFRRLRAPWQNRMPSIACIPAFHVSLCPWWTWRRRIRPSRACWAVRALRTTTHRSWCATTSRRPSTTAPGRTPTSGWCTAGETRSSDARSASPPSRTPCCDWRSVLPHTRAPALALSSVWTINTRRVRRSDTTQSWRASKVHRRPTSKVRAMCHTVHVSPSHYTHTPRKKTAECNHSRRTVASK